MKLQRPAFWAVIWFGDLNALRWKAMTNLRIRLTWYAAQMVIERVREVLKLYDAAFLKHSSTQLDGFIWIWTKCNSVTSICRTLHIICTLHLYFTKVTLLKGVGLKPAKYWVCWKLVFDFHVIVFYFSWRTGANTTLWEKSNFWNRFPIITQMFLMMIIDNNWIDIAGILSLCLKILIGQHHTHVFGHCLHLWTRFWENN